MAGRTTAMYYFYVLKSNKDNKLYFGSTSDLKRRHAEHNRGEVASTKLRRPLTLIYYEAYLDESVAREREKVVKRSGTARQTLYNRLRIGE